MFYQIKHTAYLSKQPTDSTCSVCGKRLTSPNNLNLYPLSTNTAASRANVAGLHETYTILSGCRDNPSDLTISYAPARGGSISNLSAFCHIRLCLPPVLNRLATSNDTLPPKPFNRALPAARRTKAGEPSTPTTCAPLCASGRVKLPSPQNRSAI